MAPDHPNPFDPGAATPRDGLTEALRRSADGVALLAHGRHIEVNRAYARLFGRDEPGDLVGEPWAAVLPTDELRRLEDEVVPALCERGSWRGEATGRDPDGEPVPVDLSLTLLASGGLFCVARDFSEHLAMRERLERLAYHDPLTGLPNRRLLRFRAEQAAALGRRHGHQTALLYLDLDDFKGVNDTLGHAAGDRLLQLLADRLREHVREADTPARIGGDEFAVLFASVEGEEGALRAGRRVMEAFREPFRLDGHEIELDAGAGLALHPGRASDFEELMEQADLAMYGENRVKAPGLRIYRPAAGPSTPRDGRITGELHEALRRYRLELHYQPVFGLADGRLAGAEARVRWPHPRLGLLSAAKFLHLAREAGLLLRLDRSVVARAALQLREWDREGFDGWLAVHLSEASWADGDLADRLGDVLAPLEGPIRRRFLVQLPADAGGGSSGARSALEELGVGTAMNGFAPGRASVATLRAVAPELLSIDPSLLSRARPGTTAGRLLRGVVDLGHTLGARVLGKGVENRRQRELLRQAGCDLAEGYLVGWPVPAEEFPNGRPG